MSGLSCPTSYTDAAELAQTRKRKLGHNTYLQVHDSGNFGVLYHSTEVVTFHADGRIELDSGGWRTPTTKERMNAALPSGFRLSQEKGVWYLCDHRNGWDNATEHVFDDGITIYADGSVTGQSDDNPKALLKERRQVQRFAKAYVEALASGGVPAPSGGDCWVCVMFAKGSTTTDPEHVRSHIEERYYVPSLLARAIEVFPVSQAARAYLSDRWAGTSNMNSEHPWLGVASDQLRKSLQRYMLRQLGQA